MKLDDFRFRLVSIVTEIEQLSVCNPRCSVVIDIQTDASAFVSFLYLRHNVLAVQIIEDGRPACLAEVLRLLLKDDALPILLIPSFIEEKHGKATHGYDDSKPFVDKEEADAG